QNPHNADPPDYEAAQRLLEIWTAQNELDRREWDAHQEAEDNQARQEQERVLRHQEEEEHLHLQEEEAARQEEKKKNHTKFLPFNDVKVSSTIPITPSPHALRKLRKGEYVELYYFTNKGLADAQSVSHSADNDALALMQDEQGLHSFIPIAAAKAKDTIIPDHELTWVQIDEATHRLLQAMAECGWGPEHLDAHLNFWMGLSAHEWCHDPKDTAWQALIFYQDAYCKRWHNTLGMPVSFNLKYIDEEALIKIKFKITSKLHTAITNQAKEASSFC
ncbi:hypothetical protein PAXRUDRAFT_157631, partial [Paxillus rubicundulus Ve08.2h10]